MNQNKVYGFAAIFWRRLVTLNQMVTIDTVYLTTICSPAQKNKTKKKNKSTTKTEKVQNTCKKTEYRKHSINMNIKMQTRNVEALMFWIFTTMWLNISVSPYPNQKGKNVYEKVLPWCLTLFSMRGYFHWTEKSASLSSIKGSYSFVEKLCPYKCRVYAIWPD